MGNEYWLETLENNDDGSLVRVNIRIPMSLGWIDNVYFVTTLAGRDELHKLSHIYNKDNYVYFSQDVFLNTSAVYRFFFKFNSNGKLLFMDKNSNISSYLDNNKLDKISINFEVPEWAKGATMYHIFVDRFNRGSTKNPKCMKNRHVYKSFDTPVNPGPDSNGIWNNDFYGGDLKGITDKLSFIKSLGTDIIYLSPVVESQSNHRYDAGDYENVDPYCGKNEDLKELCDKAHEMGMKVVLDAVFNHTGNDSKYFNEYGNYPNVGAFQSKDSEYSKFYKKHYAFGNLYYEYWWNMPNLPVCDKSSDGWKFYIYGKNGIIDKWFDLGIDGLRLDVADELSDEFIEGIKTAVKRNKKDGFILGEVWKNPMRMGRGYLSNGKCLDSVMNYSLVDALIRYYKYGDTYKLGYIIQDILNEYPEDTINSLMNFTSTHDISRAIDIFGSNEFTPYKEWGWSLKDYADNLDFCKNYKLTPEEYKRGKDILMSYTYALDFMPGIFSIFYGDEAGVQGLGNLMNRSPYPWNNYDEELVEYFRTLGKFRHDNEFLKDAKLNVIDINNNYFMFERTSNTEDCLVCVNRTDRDTDIFIPGKYDGELNKIYSLKNSKKTRLTPYGGITLTKK